MEKFGRRWEHFRPAWGGIRPTARYGAAGLNFSNALQNTRKFLENGQQRIVIEEFVFLYQERTSSLSLRPHVLPPYVAGSEVACSEICELDLISSHCVHCNSSLLKRCTSSASSR